MSRLKSLMPRLTALPARLSAPVSREPQSRSRFRDENQPYRKWYKTSRWQKLRAEILKLFGYTCAKCGYVGLQSRELVCDHIKPHRGDEQLFWDRSNLQCLCTSCHNSAKQKEEQGSLHMRGVWD